MLDINKITNSTQYHSYTEKNVRKMLIQLYKSSNYIYSKIITSRTPPDEYFNTWSRGCGDRPFEGYVAAQMKKIKIIITTHIIIHVEWNKDQLDWTQ